MSRGGVADRLGWPPSGVAGGGNGCRPCSALAITVSSGPEAEKAVEAGLASAKWYAPQIPRAELKALMERKDGPAIRDTLIWFAALIVTGGLGVYFWGSWAAVPFFIIYGAIYGGSSDSRWHECGHRTAFKTKWMNDAVYEIACFMVMREPEIWRWSHTRHHTDTIIVGRDPEIITPRPPDVVSLLLEHLCAERRPGLLPQALPACGRPPRPRGTNLRSRERAAQGLSQGAHLSGDLRGRHRRLRLVPLDPARDADRSPVLLRRAGLCCFSARPSISASPRTCSTTGSIRAPST